MKDRFHLLEQTIRDKFCMISWKIWQARNDRLWNDYSCPPNIILNIALNLLQDWQSANSFSSLLHQPTPYTARAPSTVSSNSFSWLCFIDGAIFPELCVSGFGIVVHNGEWVCIRAFSSYLQSCLEPHIIEVIALRQAIIRIPTISTLAGCIYSDCTRVIQAMNDEMEDNSDLGLIIRDCKDLITRHSGISLSWIRRLDNREAHLLARASSMFSSSSSFDFLPDCTNLFIN